MKKHWIFLVIGLMLLAMLGLIGIQYHFFKNTVMLKEAQFRYAANTALVQVDQYQILSFFSARFFLMSWFLRRLASC